MAQRGNNMETVKIIALAVGGYLVYKNLLQPIFDGVRGGLNSLGIGTSEEEQNVIREAQNPVSPFSPNFYKTAPPGALLIREADAQRYIDTIWNSVGWFSDDFGAVFNVFKQLKTKSQVSYLCDKWQKAKKTDLLTWLLGEQYPADRYSAAQVDQIINLVSRLPKYKV